KNKSVSFAACVNAVRERHAASESDDIREHFPADIGDGDPIALRIIDQPQRAEFRSGILSRSVISEDGGRARPRANQSIRVVECLTGRSQTHKKKVRRLSGDELS